MLGLCNWSFSSFLIFILSILFDLHCYVNIWCTAKWQSFIYIYKYTYILFFTLSSIMFHHKWFIYSSLCYTSESRCLSSLSPIDLFLFDSVLADGMSLESCPFLLDCQICWHVIVHSTLTFYVFLQCPFFQISVLIFCLRLLSREVHLPECIFFHQLGDTS